MYVRNILIGGNMAETRMSVYIQSDVYDVITDYCAQKNTSVSALSRWAITKALLPEIISRYKAIIDEYSCNIKYQFQFQIKETEEDVWSLVHDGAESLILFDLRNYDINTFVTIDALTTHLNQLKGIKDGYYIGLE